MPKEFSWLCIDEGKQTLRCFVKRQKERILSQRMDALFQHSTLMEPASNDDHQTSLNNNYD